MTGCWRSRSFTRSVSGSPKLRGRRARTRPPAANAEGVSRLVGEMENELATARLAHRDMIDIAATAVFGVDTAVARNDDGAAQHLSWASAGATRCNHDLRP